jgi:hypothetical protein
MTEKRQRYSATAYQPLYLGQASQAGQGRVERSVGATAAGRSRNATRG